MSTYHAVMIDETGCEFGVSVPEMASRSDAYDWLREMYPESRCDQLETPIEAAQREQALYDDVAHGVYYEDGQRFVEPGYEEYDYDEPEEDGEYQGDDEEYDDDPPVDDAEENFTDHADEPYHVEDSWLDGSYEES